MDGDATEPAGPADPGAGDASTYHATGSAGLFFMTYLHVHGLIPKRWSPPPKKYPSMPRSTWRSLAAICFAVGAVIGAVLGRDNPSKAVASAVVFGLLAVLVGMWAIETIWLRRRSSVAGVPPSRR